MIECAAFATLALANAGDVPCMAATFEAEARALSGREALDPGAMSDLMSLADHAEAISFVLQRAPHTANLACIYRGIAQEARERALAYAGASSSRRERHAMRKLNTLLADAASLGAITLQVDLSAPNEALADRND